MKALLERSRIFFNKLFGCEYPEDKFCSDKSLRKKQWSLTPEQIRKVKVSIINVTPSKLSFDELMKELSQ